MHAIQNYVNRYTNVGLFLNGNCGYNLQNGQITLNIGEISNQRDDANISGTLSIELWALEQPYRGGDFTGYPLTGTSLGQINGQHVIAPVNLVLNYQEPTAGSWYVTLMLREWNGMAYETCDFINFSAPLIVASNSFYAQNAINNLVNVSFTEYKTATLFDEETGQFITNEYSIQSDMTKPAANELLLLGNCGYVMQDGRITINIGEIANQRLLGNISGTLALEIWALEQAYNGGELIGVAIAGVAIGQLLGQHSFYSTSYDLDFMVPPAGTWYLTLLLREWNGSAYETRDCVNFAVPYTVKNRSINPIKTGDNIISVSFPDNKKTLEPAAKSKAPVAKISAQPSINQVPLAELVTIKGLPRKTAENIVAARPYDSFDKLAKVKGVGQKLLALLGEMFTL
ncbi:MAG: helix-hairpin-helix domain-containing protein [Methylococcaceae bacterium]|jgi:DNA uptake protein ComE-like DNA-binding protein